MVALPLRRLIDAQVLPASEQAAMLFAQDQSEAAQLLLEDELAERKTLDARLWALLFALLRIQGDWRRFDTLAEQYVLTTGMPKPVWLDRALLERLPEALQVRGAAYVELYDVEPALAERIERIAAQHSSLHLDLSRLERLDAAEAIRLTAILEELAQGVVAVIVSGTEQVANRILAILEMRPGNQLLWRLLFSIYRVQDMADEFDQACLEYTLATGFSAPGWEPPLAPILPLLTVEEKRRAPRYQPSEVIRLRGLIDDSSDAQLERLRDGAHERQYINVDLSRLARIAPAAAAALVGLANELAGWGRVVRLLRPNALIETLLETLALDARVQLIRAQS
jgi:ABC-type transporter Mla MlaB component